MRVKVHGAKDNRHLLEDIQRSISPLQGVNNVEVKPSSGSLIVHYDQSHTDFHNSLADYCQGSATLLMDPPALTEVDELEKKIEQEAEFLAQHSEVANSVVMFVKGLNADVKRATNNAVDLKVLLPLGLAVYSLLKFEAEMATPLWVTLGIFSFNFFVALHPPVRSAVSVEKGDFSGNFEALAT